MKIEIKEKGENLVVLNDDHLDNDAFIGISIVDEDGKVLGADISLLEFMPALIAFDAKRSRRLSEEKQRISNNL